MNDEIKIPTMKITPLKKICMTIGELPTSYLETMTYYEMLVWFTNYLRDSIIPAVNNNAEAVHELQVLFVELQTYVNDYFDNLDVQDEINNKLDQMLEDGVLEQIIEQYLQSSAIWGFDTINEMKEATNLIDGSYAKTLGFYEKNDGGAGLYKIRQITNDDVVDNMIIHEINDDSLIAELICEEYNLATLGSTDEIDISSKLQTFIDTKNNITLYVPEGTYKLNIVLKNKNMKVYGKGTIKGSIEQNTTFTDTNIEECYNEISGIKFTKDENTYAIKLQAGRNFKICNVNIDDSFDYGIYYNYNSAFSQRINRVLIDNNVIYSKYGIYLKDESSLGCADITFSNNILYSTITNVYLDGIDGFKDNNNTYFMPGHSTQSTTKEYNFYANRIVWLTITGSTFFESGLDGIHLTKYQNVNISDNLIGWSGQRVRSSGIYLGDYDVSGSGLYNITNVSNNIINAPAGNGITVTTNTGRININNNRLHAIGSSQYYYGETDTRDTYGIYYPLVNDNMFCSVTNNICEGKISSLSTRIFRSNNIEPNSKPSAYRLTEDVTVNDTFASGTPTTKTLSFTIPTGYALNNIRVKSIDPTNHTVQYTITIIGNVAVITNNYSTALTTTFVFEVEYIKADSFV